jgi:uncharacterized glyoxalase superfamily protein PhnB
MSKSARPADMPWLIPYLMVGDVDQALAFYQKAFNFEKASTSPGEDNKTSHGEIRYKDQVIMCGREGAQCEEVTSAKSPKTLGTPSPVMLYVYCDDVDAIYKQAIAAGAESQMEPQETHWGDKMCSLLDPFGHSWCFATHSQK